MTECEGEWGILMTREGGWGEGGVIVSAHEVAKLRDEAAWAQGQSS